MSYLVNNPKFGDQILLRFGQRLSGDDQFHSIGRPAFSKQSHHLKQSTPVLIPLISTHVKEVV
jgi:hypothetical protein